MHHGSSALAVAWSAMLARNCVPKFGSNTSRNRPQYPFVPSNGLLAKWTAATYGVRFCENNAGSDQLPMVFSPQLRNRSCVTLAKSRRQSAPYLRFKLTPAKSNVDGVL